MSFDASLAAVDSSAPTGVGSPRLLSSLQAGKGRLWVIRPSGNFGDELLFLGLETLLRRCGASFDQVRYDQVDSITFAADDIAYIHGGGGWVPLWDGTPAEVLRKLSVRHSGRIVVGPSSFSTDRDYLDTMLVSSLHAAAGRVTVFCRERPSYEALDGVIGGLAELVLEQDTALNLTRDEVLAFGDPVGPGRGYRLFALRDDAEMHPPGACRVLRAPVDPVRYCYSFTHWVRLHARAGSIVTNRLHSAICGAILGVQWADRLPPDWLGELEERLAIDRLWRQTPKLQRLMGRLRYGSSR
jgi:exopolysaccharide biosynthesis predicted pyruvyltransferase EpsI